MTARKSQGTQRKIIVVTIPLIQILNDHTNHLQNPIFFQNMKICKNRPIEQV